MIPDRKIKTVMALLADIKYLAQSFNVTSNADLNLSEANHIVHKAKCLRRIFRADHRGEYETEQENKP